MRKNTSYSFIQHAPLLIVEPDREIRVKIAKAFQRSGLRLISVGSGEDALNIIRGFGVPALAVIEITLPDMSGLELANRLKQTRAVPIIMSGFNVAADTVATILDLLAEDFIHKPYNEMELAARVYRILLRTSPSTSTSDETIMSKLRGRDILRDHVKNTQ